VGVAPALVKIPMSEAAFLALGETKHHEYYDGMCVSEPAHQAPPSSPTPRRPDDP